MQDLRCSESTPSQRLAAAARRERQQRFERSAISRVHDIVELPVDKTERPVLPIIPEPPTPPEPDAIEQWTKRQRAIHKPLWFGIVDEIEVDSRVATKITIEDIQRAICKYFNVMRIDLLSARRSVQIVRPRQVGYYLSKMLTAKSLPEIGRRFGGRDHTSCLAGIRRITQLRVTDEAINNAVLTITASLGGAIA